MALLLVFLGGGLGAVARHLLSLAIAGFLGPAFPWGTLAVNLLGCLLLGVLAQIGLTGVPVPGELRLLLGTGFLGGFTTYSTFNQDTLRLLADGAWGAGLANAAATGLGGLTAAWLGMALVRALG